MNVRSIACATVFLGLLAGLPTAEAMPVGAGLSTPAATGQLVVEKAKVVIRKTTIIKRPHRTIIRKTIIRR